MTSKILDLTETTLFGVLSLIYVDLQKSEDVYAPADCYTLIDGLYMELKCRRIHYDALLLEKLKYDRLKEMADRRKMKPVYICSTPKGVWKFDLSEMQLNWAVEQLPKTTDFGNQELVSKVVTYLPVTFGRKLADQYLTKQSAPDNEGARF